MHAELCPCKYKLNKGFLQNWKHNQEFHIQGLIQGNLLFKTEGSNTTNKIFIFPGLKESIEIVIDHFKGIPRNPHWERELVWRDIVWYGVIRTHITWHWMKTIWNYGSLAEMWLLCQSLWQRVTLETISIGELPLFFYCIHDQAPAFPGISIQDGTIFCKIPGSQDFSGRDWPNNFILGLMGSWDIPGRD